MADDATEKKIVEPTKRETIAFGFGALTDQMSHQAFQSLIFMFYWAVIGVDVSILAIGFIIFAIWDSINDPILGPISDRTRTRWGRRKFWILVSIVPFALVNFLLFTSPMGDPLGDHLVETIYFLVIIIVYDLVYTVFSTNQLALFPEMFKTEQQRSRANVFKNILTIVGLLLGTALPVALIDPMIPDNENPAVAVEAQYILMGGILAILVVVFGFLYYRYGMKEDPVNLTKPQELPGIKASLKRTLRNKTFLIFIFANLLTWFVFKLLTTTIILYGIKVLLIEQPFLRTALLLCAFLSAAAFFPVQRKIGNKIGMRNGFMVSGSVWIASLIPFWFIDGNPIAGLVCMALMGFGLSGAMYYVDIIIASVIDEDEVKNGCRREGAFYGVNALINRYSTILVFVIIAVVLTGFGWEEFLIDPTKFEMDYLAQGLKILVVVCPIIGICGILVLLKFFPLHGERWQKVQDQLKAIRERKACEVP
ncbi:MAG: major facilitator superfamily transporter [Promethearchaeota archaeon CR_4]|nr:MAG: major facilitator superfamily transporter [Candidatus Lokiarchaeota archaeon CR_4]